MQRFFDSIVSPLLEIAAPEEIVEIGSFRGQNTRNILGRQLRSTRGRGPRLHAIDPAPAFDVGELVAEYGDRFVFYRAMSLDALPHVGRIDTALIDGDHNWHTAISELRLLKQLARGRGEEFPLVVLHDVGWPYGRRDVYHAPERIPAEYRKPAERKGMVPGHPGLVEEGGSGPNRLNATVEGEPHSGVLTAVEDFVRESATSFRLVVVEGLNGLAVLAPESLLTRNPDLRHFLDGLEPSPALARHLKRVEAARIEAVIARQEARRRLRLMREKGA